MGQEFVQAVKATGRKQLIIAGVVTEVCVVFPALSALAEGYDVFVVTDASGTFNTATRQAALTRMSQAGAQLMSWFGVACELHRDWRNDIEGLGTLFSNHISDYRNLITSYSAKKQSHNLNKLDGHSPPSLLRYRGEMAALYNGAVLSRKPYFCI